MENAINYLGVNYQPVEWVPTRAEVIALSGGDLALNPWGKWARVVEIFGRGDDVNGKAFVCYYTDEGRGSRISNSIKEDELTITVDLSRFYTSDQCRAIERQILNDRKQGVK